MTDRDDRILDGCLEELLGEQSPPDLSDRILDALAARGGHVVAAGLPGDSPRPVRPAPIVLRDSVPPARSSTSAQRPLWLAAAVAATLLAMATGYGLARWWRPHDPAPNLARQPAQDRPERAPRLAPDRAPPQQRQPPPPEQPAVAVTPRVPPAPPTAAAKQQASEAIVDSPPAGNPPSIEQPATPLPVAPARQLASASRTDDEIIEEINSLVRDRWTSEGVKPASLATDAEWCRRVYLDIVGRLPTLEETNRYLAERGQQKRARLVERLLDSDTGVEEYARNWTNIWTALLIGRASQPGSLAHREGMQQYLRRALLRNKPYDEMVGELISAEGTGTPGDEEFNGAVNFLLDNMQENALPATAKTARLFLGVQVQCTQCHHHPFNTARQDQFWELNSFFRQAKARRRERDGSSVVALSDADFAGEGQGSIHEAEVYWEMRNGLLKVSYPAFIDGTRIDPSGAVDRVNRRDELARLVMRSPELPRAMANRLWGHFLGYGFTRPIDDMGPHNAPSHPEVLDLLSRAFADGGFDLKRLIRWIALSEAYALSSRVPPATLKSGRDDPAAGAAPLFSYFYVRQMRPEELYESLLALAGQRGRGSYEEQERAKTGWLSQFTTSYATEENDEYTTFNGSITQTLMMFNGELIREASRLDQGTFLRSVAASDDKPTIKITRLFLAALGRKPSNAELQMAHQHWLDRKQDGHAALQDIWWAVLNSNEFIMNH